LVGGTEQSNLARGRYQQYWALPIETAIQQLKSKTGLENRLIETSRTVAGWLSLVEGSWASVGLRRTNLLNTERVE
jgi:hypothetical protein